MSYLNPYSLGAEAARSLDSGEYSINSHGDIGAHYNSIMNADLPEYTTMFYRQSPHESFSELKYDKLNLDYDKGMKRVRDSVRGLPIEAYIPNSVIVPDGVGANSSVILREPEVMPAQNIIEEILKAQAKVMGKDKKQSLFIRATEIEQEIHIKRRLRKLEIIRKG